VKTNESGVMNKIIMELEWSYGKCLWRWSGGGGRNLEFRYFSDTI
jgi:hypothetical protein